MERRESRIAEVDAKLKALKQELAQIQNSIRALSESGVKEIAKLGDKAIAKLQELAEETKKWGELRAEVGKLEKELMYARYLTTGDQAVLKSFPKEVVITFLDRALSYCKLNQLNPMVRVPDGFPRKYSTVYSSTQVDLLDLIAWAEAGLVGASQ